MRSALSIVQDSLRSALRLGGGGVNARQVILYTVLAVGVVASIYVLYLLRNVLILIFIAIVLATAIAPLVDRLRSLIGAGRAVLTIYLGIALVLGTIGYLMFRVLLEQTATLATNLPAIIATLQAYASGIEVPFLRQMLLDLLNESAAVVTAREPGTASGVAQGVFSVTVSLLTFAFGFTTVLLISYYWIMERPAILRLFVSLFPAEKRAVAYTIWQEIELKLGGWVRGQLILMAIIAAMAAVGYTVMGLKYALLLAVIAGLTEMIPILGPWIGSAPAVLVALTQDFWLAVAIGVYAVIIQTLEGNLFVPRIVGRSTGVSPLVVIIALLVGLTLMGITGALLAVPIASALQVIVQSLLLEPEPLPHSSTSPSLRG